MLRYPCVRREVSHSSLAASLCSWPSLNAQIQLAHFSSRRGDFYKLQRDLCRRAATNQEAISSPWLHTAGYEDFPLTGISSASYLSWPGQMSSGDGCVKTSREEQLSLSEEKL